MTQAQGDDRDRSLFPASKMGFGCMRLPTTDPDDSTSIDVDQLKDMVDVFMEAGNTYFDTAYAYHNGTSEVALKKALVDRYPRDAYTIATKCLAWTQPTAEDAKACLDTSLERLGVDYVDYYLLHNIGGKRTQKFDDYGLWDYFAQKKAEGTIRHLGFSMHDGPETLDKILAEHPDMDFVQLQVNYLDWEDPLTQSRRLMEVAEDHDKPVIIMEPARGGRLCNLPDEAAEILREANPEATQASWAYRFCWNLPNVLVVLSGMSTIEQARENVTLYAANEPLTPEEGEVLTHCVDVLRSMGQIPCTNCRYCVKGCPQHVKIPETLSLLNLESMTKDSAFVKDLYSWQTAEGRASDCIACGQCESMCPQGINIIEQLKVAVEHFEDDPDPDGDDNPDPDDEPDDDAPLS